MCPVSDVDRCKLLDIALEVLHTLLADYIASGNLLVDVTARYSVPVYVLKSDTVIDISPIIPTPSPQKFPRPHSIPVNISIPIKSAVLHISADNLTVYRRH